MKKLIVTLVVLLPFFTAAAQEKVLKEMDAVKISKSEVPGPLVQKVQKDFPNVSPFQYYMVGDTAMSRDWKITDEVNFSEGDKIDHYSVEMKGKDGYYHALYDANGKLLMSRVEQKDVALPSAVMKSIGRDYEGIGLKKDKHYKLVDHGKKTEYYEVTLNNGKKLYYKKDGTQVKK